MQIRVTENGPYRVTGAVPLATQTIGTDDAGTSREWLAGAPVETPGDNYSLCRCGHSNKKPFCDGTHAKIGFDGTEVATRATYLAQATEQDGPEVTLTDAQQLCAFARFCDADGQVWNLVEQPGAQAAAATTQQSQDCPSGRLVASNLAERTALEPELPKSIALVEDPAQGVSGPLWVRGGIQVTAADGADYEVRNRVTLCRCGASRNKPFCDGSHAAIGFTDAPG
ncbi:CDGSH iron-sulfur domain-containing protein [Nocardia sp. NPDC006630]|uniref:CDGSH iron-sulfur domain-containing protein n=1 Tax=Nocardia sp. NPDC006630 TaxID=3157181 RepID=UPI0033AF2EF0